MLELVTWIGLTLGRTGESSVDFFKYTLFSTKLVSTKVINVSYICLRQYTNTAHWNIKKNNASSCIKSELFIRYQPFLECTGSAVFVTSGQPLRTILNVPSREIAILT